MNRFQSPMRAALAGANLAFAGALAYATVFAILASVRSALVIRSIIGGSASSVLTMLANGASIFIVSVQFAIGLGLVAALIQGLTWMLTGWLSEKIELRADLLALLVCLPVAAGLHLLLWNSAGVLHAMLWRTIGGYLFWLGLPSLIYIGMTFWVWRAISTARLTEQARLMDVAAGLLN